MAEGNDLFALRGSALASLWGLQAAPGHHTAKEANAQQAAEQAAAGQSAGQAAAGQAAADQAAADQAPADQAASDLAASDQTAEQEAADQAAAAADTQQVEAQKNTVHTSVIRQPASGVGDGHHSTGSQMAARGTLATAPGSPSEAAGMHREALFVKALPSTSSEAMLSGHTGLPASTDLMAFPDSPQYTGQQRLQHRTQSTHLPCCLEHISTDHASIAGADIPAETPNEGVTNAEQLECMVDGAASATAASAKASATALPATTIASATAAETTPPADEDTPGPALNPAGVGAMAPALPQSPQSIAQVARRPAL